MKIVDTLDHSDLYDTSVISLSLTYRQYTYTLIDRERTLENLATFRKLASDYILHIHDNWVHSMVILELKSVPQCLLMPYPFPASSFRR